MADTYVWKMGANGKPTNEYLLDSSDLPDAPLTQPYPKTMWHIVDGKLTHDFMLKLPESSLTQPYPKTMWRIDKNRNSGKPYHEFLPIPEIPPPPSKWKFAFSDSKKALFSVKTDMRFGIEISDYKFSFSVSD